MLFFVLLGIITYTVILTGWSVVRTFSKLGALRGILQSLAYEVALILIVIIILTVSNTLLLSTNFVLEIGVLWLIAWVLISIIESNRAPFDLLEGERELIRGFNIEIGRLIFVLLFLREYGSLIILSWMTVFLVNGSRYIMTLVFIIVSCILILRRCFPRLRYDLLIRLMWIVLLPLAIARFYFFSLIK